MLDQRRSRTACLAHWRERGVNLNNYNTVEGGTRVAGGGLVFLKLDEGKRTAS